MQPFGSMRVSRLGELPGVAVRLQTVGEFMQAIDLQDQVGLPCCPRMASDDAFSHSAADSTRAKVQNAFDEEAG